MDIEKKLSAKECADLIKNKQITAVEITTKFLEKLRINKDEQAKYQSV